MPDETSCSPPEQPEHTNSGVKIDKPSLAANGACDTAYDHPYFFNLLVDGVRVSLRVAWENDDPTLLSALHDSLPRSSRRLWCSESGETFYASRLPLRNSGDASSASYVGRTYKGMIPYYLRLHAREDDVQVWTIPWSPTEDTPQIVIVFHAGWCHDYGNDLSAFNRRAQAIAMQLGAESVHKSWLNRLDIACDLPITGQEIMTTSCAKGYSKGIKKWLYDHDGRPTGFNNLPNEGQAFAAYDKRTREDTIRDSVYVAYWHEIGIADQVPIFRIEGRFGKERLEKLDAGSALVTPDAINRVWAWFSDPYLRFVDRRDAGEKRKDRQRIAPFWRRVQQARYHPRPRPPAIRE